MTNDYNFLHSSLNENLNDSSKDIVNLSEYKILLVEDDESFGHSVKIYLEKFFELEVIHFSNPSLILEFLDQNKSLKFCLISDISFGETSTDGLFLVDLLTEKKLEFFTIMMTGFASIETAITATKKGVFHYLTKPFELKFLKEITSKGIAEHFNINENLFLKSNNKSSTNIKSTKTNFCLEEPRNDDLFNKMIGRADSMKSVFDRIEKVAFSSSTVLITGASGTGKELVAKALHNLSPRKNAPMISVNCGAIPADLLESELFGHTKGSFTGAISDRIGRFEQANGGTIFLDEIGDMPILLQVKLLRVLQNREIERVGGNKTIPIDVRIITATHRHLEKSVEQGNFREDLFYRLNVIPVKLPSLCDRKEDIPLLISYFRKKFISFDGRNNIEFSSKSLEILLTYKWPGNVRELENLIERLIILKGGTTIDVDDLPTKILSHLPNVSKSVIKQVVLPEVGLNLKSFLCEIEDSLINQALEVTGGNKNQASKLLQMNRTTLIEKLKKKTFIADSKTD